LRHGTITRSLVGIVLLGYTVLASGQSYPTGPVRVILPFPAGGGNDSMGRILSQKLTEAFGRQFIIENRAGANGMVGSELVARAPKDGYTLLVNGANFVTTPSQPVVRRPCTRGQPCRRPEPAQCAHCEDHAHARDEAAHGEKRQPRDRQHARSFREAPC
jgi:tripartite-type tricarboxylate transporter receptor subunit TctC